MRRAGGADHREVPLDRPSRRRLEAVGFDYNGIHISQDTFHLFPGLCAVDNRENLDTMFRLLGEHGIQTARAGAYKPRTSPYDFQGLAPSACLSSSKARASTASASSRWKSPTNPTSTRFSKR